MRLPRGGRMTNNDPRYTETKRILNEITDNLPVKLYKTTRAGVTTGICANSIDADQRFMLIAPTREIAHNTIQDSLKYSSRFAEIKRLLSNHACLINKKTISKFPDVGKIPILPLPKKCENCEHFYDCEVTDFLRTDINDIGGVGLTHQKLMAIMFSDSDAAKSIKNRFASMFKVVVFDEAHNYETPNVSSVKLYPHYDLTPWQTLFKNNKKISPFLEMFATLKHDLEPNIMQLLSVKEDAYKNRMAIEIDRKKNPVKFKQIVKAINEIINVMKHRDKYNLSVDQVLFIFNIVMLFASDQLVLHYIKTDDGDSVHLSAKDGMVTSVKMFLGRLEPFINKKIIFTSATFGDFDYTSIFGFHNTAFMPDVMESNKKMTIFADSFKMDSINYRRKNFNKIIDAVERYEKWFPGIPFICMRRNVAWWITDELKDRGYAINADYYRSDRTIGVASDKRRCVCVGAPISPINAFDGITDTFDKSQRLRTGENHAAFWQAISRFKDPNGNDESFVYCIGIKEDEIKKMVTWGVKRNLIMNGNKCREVRISDSKRAFPLPVIFGNVYKKAFEIIKTQNEGISRNDLRHKLRINSKTLDTVLSDLLTKNIIEEVVKSGIKKPVHFYRST